MPSACGREVALGLSEVCAPRRLLAGWGDCPETSSSLQQTAGMLPVLPELPPGVFGSDQILCTGVCSVSRSPRHHLDKLDVFGMYQMEIPASPNFLSVSRVSL